nr:unnamed protein product [Callosobruchus chinensis]
MPHGSRKRRRSWSLSKDRSKLKLLKGTEKRIKRLEHRSTGQRSSNSGSDEGSIARNGGDSNCSSPDSDVDDMQGVAREVSAVETVAAPLQKPLDANTLMLLGDDVVQKTSLEVSLQQEIAERYLYIAKHGLEKSVRKSLVEKYPLPENCALVGPPQLNRRHIGKYSTATVSNFIRNSQDTLEYIRGRRRRGDECAKDAIEALNEAGHLLTDVVHSESMSRRELASHDLNKEWKNTFIESPLDKCLFGGDLLKAAKELQISSRQLKYVKNNTKLTASRSQSLPHLNSKSLPQSY